MTTTHTVRTYKSSEPLAAPDQLAGKLAALAAEQTRPLDDASVDMVINRIIDNAAVATASIGRAPVVSARGQAEAHPYTPGATVFGLAQTQRVSPEWAAWANGV
ncbi:MAG: MmgE/PrpD family protein, partial [Microcella sp.]|nr:MmgE/PrpD family protein [Microcella sp.]